MNICKSNRAISAEVLGFIRNVADVNEESITDYLLWKWRELDKRFNYLSATKFDHAEESRKTGADFDLELWLVGSKTHIALAVQAKKFLNRYDTYVSRLNYPNGTKRQMTTLLAYAASSSRVPFYFMYSTAGKSSVMRCGCNDAGNCGVFMVHAEVMEKFADGKRGKRVSLDQLLSASNPFHCMFCCPLMPEGVYLNNFLASAEGEFGKANTCLPNDGLPLYVKRLLHRGGGDLFDEDQRQANSNDGWHRFRSVGVYDLSGDALSILASR